MTAVGAISILLGLAMVLGCTIWLIVRLIRKRPPRTPLMAILSGIVLFIAGIVISATIGDVEKAPTLTPHPTLTAEPTYLAIDSTPTPHPTPTPIPDGKARTEPLPYGFPVVLSDIEVTVLDTTRGLVSEDSLQREPEEGHEWVVVKLRLRNVGDPNETRHYGPNDFRLTGQSGVIFSWGLFDFLLGTDNSLESGEFFGGAEVVGDVVLQVDKEDSNLILIYSPPFRGSRYLSLEKP